MRDLIRTALAGSQPADDPVASALSGDLPESARRHLLAQPIIPAAVLIPLIDDKEIRVVLTQRSEGLAHHAGQISFPGGRLEANDSGPADAALRECEEEIGLQRSEVELLGFLPPYLTITRYVVTPVVGLLQPDYSAAPDLIEVDEVFEVPLAYLLDPANRVRRTRQLMGSEVDFYEIIWQGRSIWGATAAMLIGFSKVITMTYERNR